MRSLHCGTVSVELGKETRGYVKERGGGVEVLEA